MSGGLTLKTPALPVAPPPAAPSMAIQTGGWLNGNHSGPLVHSYATVFGLSRNHNQNAGPGWRPASEAQAEGQIQVTHGTR